MCPEKQFKLNRDLWRARKRHRLLTPYLTVMERKSEDSMNKLPGLAEKETSKGI